MASGFQEAPLHPLLHGSIEPCSWVRIPPARTALRASGHGFPSWEDSWNSKEKGLPRKAAGRPFLLYVYVRSTDPLKKLLLLVLECLEVHRLLQSR